MHAGKIISEMGKGIEKRRVVLTSSTFIIGLALASCTTTSINQNGRTDNACANNASCSQSQEAGKPSRSRSRSSMPSASPQTSAPAAASAPRGNEPQYSSVSFSSLCSSQTASQSDFQDCSDEQTAQIGQKVYDFSTWGPAYDPASDDDPPLLSFPSTTCRRLSLRFAIVPGPGIPSELRVKVSVMSQGSRSVIVAPNRLGRLVATLSGGPFEIDASANMPMGGGWNILMDGSASCSTDSGS